MKLLQRLPDFEQVLFEHVVARACRLGRLTQIGMLASLASL